MYSVVTKRYEALSLSASACRQLSDKARQCSGPAGLDLLDEMPDIEGIQVVEIGPIKEDVKAAAEVRKSSRMHPDRRLASLVSFAHVFEATAMDDALDVFDMLVTEIIRDAELCRKKERWRTLRDLDAAALLLREACQIVLDDACEDSKLRETIFSVANRDELANATRLVEALARPADAQHQKELIDRYRRVRVQRERVTLYSACSGYSDINLAHAWQTLAGLGSGVWTLQQTMVH